MPLMGQLARQGLTHPGPLVNDLPITRRLDYILFRQKDGILRYYGRLGHLVPPIWRELSRYGGM